MKKPARGPVCFCNRRSGSKIAKAITWQPEPEQQPEQPGQQPERPEQQRQELEQQQERPEQQQPGHLFCHRR
mgnify:CR=1 FL=1